MAIVSIYNPAPDDPTADTLHVTGNKCNDNFESLDDDIQEEITNRTINERGILWNSARNYVIGDTSTEGDFIYIALTNNINKQPSLNSSDWEGMTDREEAIRGIAWNSSTTYSIGDVCTEDLFVYVSKTSNTNSLPSSSSTNWIKIGSTGGTGGGLWNSGTNYSIGDIASESGIIYTSLTSNINKQPSSNESDWQSCCFDPDSLDCNCSDGQQPMCDEFAGTDGTPPRNWRFDVFSGNSVTHQLGLLQLDTDGNDPISLDYRCKITDDFSIITDWRGLTIGTIGSSNLTGLEFIIQLKTNENDPDDDEGFRFLLDTFVATGPSTATATLKRQTYSNAIGWSTISSSISVDGVGFDLTLSRTGSTVEWYDTDTAITDNDTLTSGLEYILTVGFSASSVKSPTVITNIADICGLPFLNCQS